jgi:hypothetical protein
LKGRGGDILIKYMFNSKERKERREILIKYSYMFGSQHKER